ncbi:uncharacterized protein ARMOST_15221 [Armillaria ostoyae]|uniref:Uncharacterized protein n=1 Tax=Armillaria ostoyae TaxID=47428 RepID=A0A284RSS2_ARMOS|nr:uncharacterized protein ARMOST_15221 [Armillaria ostoyae]
MDSPGMPAFIFASIGKRMRALDPEFINITWNTGGRTSDLTIGIVESKPVYILPVPTCPKRKLISPYEYISITFDYVLLRFPQQQLLPPEEHDQELKYLKKKVDTGVSFIFIQMFYDVQVFVAWVNAVPKGQETIKPLLWKHAMSHTQLSQRNDPQSFW